MILTATAVLTMLAASVPAQAADAVKPASSAYMAPFDKDKNGVTTPAERKTGRNAKFAEMDKNGDKKLTKEEFANGHLKWRADSDANKDNLVELGEYTLFFCGEEPKPETKGKHASSQKNYVDCVGQRTAFFVEADLDKNGKLTEAEQRVSYSDSFKKMDHNNNNVIEVDEFYTFKMPVDGKKPVKAKTKPEAAKETKPAAKAEPAAK